MCRRTDDIHEPITGNTGQTSYPPFFQDGPPGCFGVHGTPGEDDPVAMFSDGRKVPYTGRWKVVGAFWESHANMWRVQCQCKKVFVVPAYCRPFERRMVECPNCMTVVSMERLRGRHTLYGFESED